MNTENVKPALLRSFRTLLSPLVRLLLRNAVVFDEFVETVKQSMVETAVRDMRPESASLEAVARKTGLTIEDVTRIVRECVHEPADMQESDNDRAIKVLEGWHRDQGYVGIYGLANELNRKEFNELSQRYAPERTTEHILGLLVDADCVRVSRDPDSGEARIRCINRTFVAKPSTVPQIERIGRVIANFVSTVDNNVHGLGEPRLEKRVWPATGLHKRFLPAFDEVVRERTDEYLLSIDNWLSSYHTERVGDATEADVVQTGVGVFHYLEAEDSRRPFKEVLEEKGLVAKELL